MICWYGINNFVCFLYYKYIREWERNDVKKRWDDLYIVFMNVFKILDFVNYVKVMFIVKSWFFSKFEIEKKK